MPKARILRPEQAIQIACVEYLTYQENLGRLSFAHVPNGGRRTKAEAGIFKAMGVRAGFPDLIILPTAGRVAAFIEVKAPRGRADTDQEEWAKWLVLAGYRYDLITSVDQLDKALKRWGIVPA